ncbi:hypothetical protein FOL47_000927 [Perkinsus chesapeaki]|uniref:Carboxypeptidase n=1 Tax=Perkinsus chesapeaki TaxID=330153 RepID=A0A7J6N0W3_PERCH|nr:hypothetical protein FOL47_000927 [Perkinsus chesapeaki]
MPAALPTTLVALIYLWSVSGLPVDLSKISTDPKVTEIRSDAGMVSINSNLNSSMFYWYFPPLDDSLQNDVNTPLILWIQGGPGSSGFIGNFFELGPLNLINRTTLVRRNVTWANSYHMVFVDSPVGTGYSYTDYPEGYANNTEHDVTEQLYTFLTTFYREVKPELKEHPLFIVGESYAGHYIPALGKYLIENPIDKIPLSGVAIGDGLTFPAFQVAAKADVAYYFGLIGPDRIDEARELGQKGKKLALEGRWLEALEARKSLEKLMQEESGGINLYDIRTTDDYGWQDERLEHFLNLPEVKATLHVPVDRSFKTDEAVEAHLLEDIMMPMVHCLPPLLNAEVPVMLFEGDKDAKDGLISVEAWIPELPWDGISDYLSSERNIWRGRDPTSPQEAVYGYERHYGPLSHYSVRNAGHMVPMDQPDAAMDLIKRFIINAISINDTKSKSFLAASPEIE